MTGYLREVTVFVESKRLKDQRDDRHQGFNDTELKSSLCVGVCGEGEGGNETKETKS